MTTFETNQLSFFDDQFTPSAAVSAAVSATPPTVSDDATGSDSQLMTLILRHQNRIWPNEKTRQNTVARIQRFDAFGDHSQLELKDITSGHIYDWLDAEQMTPRSKEGDKGHPKYPSEATINRYASAISAALTFACESRLINGVPKLRYSKEFARERYMTDSEIEQLITLFNERGEQWMVDLVYVGVNTGMRLGEILSLGIIQNGKYSFFGEAEVKRDSVYLPPKITKNDLGRHVSINSDVREACLRLQKSLGRHFTSRKFYDRWEEARARIAPGDQQFVFHGLRHTCASRMANELGMNTLLIKEQLGHKSITTTEKYVHSKPETKAAFAQQMSVGASLVKPIGVGH